MIRGTSSKHEVIGLQEAENYGEHFWRKKKSLKLIKNKKIHYYTHKINILRWLYENVLKG
jgi:hypothetical protein